ncbi:hypothetical protein ACOBQJ_12060 [Pelotomaculum propionicicum]|uniref:hypothetical protein n=1 Tax=Pelotomaculum propionicicum TaxID=258475 RepID=UPI003B773C8E
MPVASGRMELWRRMALLLGVIAGLALFFYVAPALVSVTAVDWAQEQADELRSPSGYVSAEDKRLSQLPLEDYIKEKTGGKATPVDSRQWADFFQQVQLASGSQYGVSSYGDRVSDEDKDAFWKPIGPVQVFFKPDEIPWAQWGLAAEDGDGVYVSTTVGGKTAYLLLRYLDYNNSVSAMSKPYRVAPGWLYHPYRNLGLGIMAAGLLLYIFLPRRRKQPDDIAYSAGSMLAGDIVALILLLPFYGLPFLVNGGTVQAVTGMWPVSAAMWFLACICVMLLYYNAWYASYRIELTPEAMYRITFRGVQEYRFDEIATAGLVTLRNPGWFRKLFMALALISFMGRRSSPQPVGSAILAAGAAYGGLEISGRGKPLYIWFTDQWGGTIIRNFNRVPEAFRSAGVRINQEPREIEGFSMFL